MGMREASRAMMDAPVSKVVFVKIPIPLLRFISRFLRRATCTPRNARFARLDLGSFYKAKEYVLL
jgi:hypothetical protein